METKKPTDEEKQIINDVAILVIGTLIYANAVGAQVTTTDRQHREGLAHRSFSAAESLLKAAEERGVHPLSLMEKCQTSA